MQTKQPQQGQVEKSIQRTITVPVSAERAFDTLTAELATWRPAEYQAMLDSPQGWATILNCYSEAIKEIE